MNSLVTQLKEIGINPIVIGDAAKAPGTIHGATEAAVNAIAEL